MESIVHLDFGNCLHYGKAGYITVGRVYTSPRFLWIDDVREVWRVGQQDPLLLSSVQGQQGELRVGLPPGNYVLKLYFFDPLQEHGPFSLAVASIPGREPRGAGEQRVILAGMVVPPGCAISEQLEVRHTGGALALRFMAPIGRTFIINALDVLGPDGTEAQSLFPEAPSDVLPTIQEVLETGHDDPQAALRQVCEWLMGHRHRDGFLGDPEGAHRWWYTSAYPVRTLLAGYEILREECFRTAAQEILDCFVDEQMPEGAFPQSYQGRRLADLSPIELGEIRAKNWLNLADIGSMVSSLAFAGRYFSGERRARYLAAVRKYLDSWARQFQQPNGGFTNGWLAGRQARWIYGVATGTTALAFAFYAGVSGEPGYIEAAEHAAEFLTRDWHEDGRPFVWPFDDSYPGTPFYQRVRDIGEQFYYLDGIIGTAHHSHHEMVRRRVFEALRRYLLGSQGLTATWQDAPWWPIQDIWNNSKSAATPLFLQEFLRHGYEYGATPEEREHVEKVYQVSRRFLCTPEYSRLIGVMVDDPNLPWGGHSLQSWAGCAVTATGLAGLALAEMIKPGIAFLA